MGICPYSPSVLPSPCTCLALRRATRRLTQQYDAALAPSGLRVTQFSLLNVLDRLGAATVQQLADELAMDRSTLGHNLRPLERDGLVRLEVDPDDRRARRLVLGTQGKAALAEARPLWRAAQARFESAYGKERAGELGALLHAVAEVSA